MSIYKIRLFITVIFILLAAFVLSESVAAQGRPFSVVLNPDDEIPGPGDPDGSGTAFLTLNQGQGEICYELTVENIALPASGAHIHEAPAGDPGPILVTLTPPNADGISSGCVEKLDKELIKSMRQNPHEYYVNIHTSQYPAGALRGQLVK